VDNRGSECATCIGRGIVLRFYIGPLLALVDWQVSTVAPPRFVLPNDAAWLPLTLVTSHLGVAASLLHDFIVLTLRGWCTERSHEPYI